MIQQIHSLPDYATLTPEQIHTALSVEVDQPTHTAVTLAMIIDAVGEGAYPLVRMTLEAATVPADDTPAARMQAAHMADALAAMRTVGLSLSPPERQAVIDGLAIAGEWPDEVRDAIKRLGVRAVSTWAVLGGVGDVPTKQAITDAIEAEAASKRHTARNASLNNAIDAVRTGVDLSSAETVMQDVLDAIDTALEAEWQ